jgi:molybdate transport system substrate-binding protein
MKRRLVILAAIALCAFVHAASGRAGEVLVAAASDLSFPIKEIIAEFEKETGNTVKLTIGSSGNFHAQIVSGAPFDVYISADVEYVRQLDQQKLVEPNTIYVYGVGRLVVWVPNGSPLDVKKLGMQALAEPAAKRVAIANPNVAPYGRAAVAALRHYKLYDRVSPRLVMGENIAQTAQFLSTGAADIGIIAHSLALSDAMRSSGQYWEVPLDAYPKLEQASAILTQARKANHYETARAFYDWFRNDRSRAILTKYGFSPPK